MTGEYPDRDPEMFYGLARDRHAAQAALLDSLDSKLVFILSGSSALVGILVAVCALRPDAFDGWEFVLPAASGAAWLALTCFALHAFRPVAWLSGPNLAAVFNDQFSRRATQRSSGTTRPTFGTTTTTTRRYRIGRFGH